MEDKAALVDKVDCFIFDCDGELNQEQSCSFVCPQQQHLFRRQAHAFLQHLSISIDCFSGQAGACLPAAPQPHTPPPAAGVIWRGDSVIDGVPETLDMLRSMVGAGGLAAGAAVGVAAPHTNKQ